MGTCRYVVFLAGEGNTEECSLLVDLSVSQAVFASKRFILLAVSWEQTLGDITRVSTLRTQNCGSLADMATAH